MPHVDEGTIQTYLDRELEFASEAGRRDFEAHLEECDACAGRFAEYRALVAESDAILARADTEARPDDAAFEAIQRRTRAPSGPSGRRLRDLAMAATVILALGAGMYWRVTSTGTVQAPPSITEMASKALPSTGDDVTAPIAAPEPEELGRMATEVSSAGARGAGQPSADPAGGVAEGFAATEPAAPAEDRIDALAERSAEAAEGAAAAVAPAPAPARTGEVDADSAIAVYEAAQPVSADERRERFARMQADAEPAAQARDQIAQSTASATAEARLGGRIWIVDGAGVVRIDEITDRHGAAVRVVQELPDGTRITLIERPNDETLADQLGAAAAAADSLPGDSAVSMQRVITVSPDGQVMIELLGPLPEPALQALADRLTPNP